MRTKAQQRSLQVLELPPWKMRGAVAAAPASPRVVSIATETEPEWEELRTKVANCTACELSCGRTQTVFGVGNSQASLLIVGEAPGQQEDLTGVPFVGRGGKLLDSMLHSIGFDRTSLYIANVLKCRPPNNRDPLPSEVATCTPFLKQQIQLMQPKLIVAVGRIAGQYLLQTDRSMAELRGPLWQYGEQKTPLMVTYHPAYLLRSPREKRKAYGDWLHVKAFLHS